MRSRPTAAIVIAFVLAAFIGVGLSAWSRNVPKGHKVAGTEANIEKVATQYRIVNIGDKSVYVPSEDGGTGNRVMVEVTALQVRGVNGVWADLVWAWGMTDDVVPYLQALQREHETRNDVLLFGRPDYQPHFQFQPF